MIGVVMLVPTAFAALTTPLGLQVQAAPPTAPPKLHSNACGIIDAPTDSPLLVVERSEVRNGRYFLALRIGAFQSDVTLPPQKYRGLLFLRLDGGPSWSIAPTPNANDFFYLSLADIAKGSHRLLISLAMRGKDNGWYPYGPSVATCFTISPT
jgi:hypothetical protein